MSAQNPSPLFPESELPAPRLELRWTSKGHQHVCTYSIVIPLRDGDIRREDENGIVVSNEQTVAIMRTTRHGGGSPRQGDEIEVPFRDCQHAEWDAQALKLPAYVVCDGQAQRLE